MSKDYETTTELVEVETQRTHTPAEQILAPLDLSDYSQFLYDTNFGGVKGQDFTAEGIKTLGLNNGISTSDVRVEFLNDEKNRGYILLHCDRQERRHQRCCCETKGERERQNQSQLDRERV